MVYKTETPFTPPTPRPRPTPTEPRDDGELRTYRFTWTEVIHEYCQTEIEATNEEEAWDLWHGGCFDADCYDSESVDAYEPDIEEIT